MSGSQLELLLLEQVQRVQASPRTSQPTNAVRPAARSSSSAVRTELARLSDLAARAIDGIDRRLWEIEQREALRQKHAIPPGQETRELRRQEVSQHRAERD